MNKNVCGSCIDNTIEFIDIVADTGLCGQCLKLRECMDIDLINTYRSHDISDEDIWEHLPRLRHAHTEISISFSENQITRLIERFKNGQ